MIGYIYHITNTINGKKYIGKTCNIDQRIWSHFSDLRLQKHHSHKLQRAVNKYGIENFKITYEVREVKDEEELSRLEIEEIEKYNSYREGYNETLGGEGHKTVFDFNQSVLIYQICKRYEGVGRKIAKYYGCDHTVISAIKNNFLYDQVEYNEKNLLNLIQTLNLSNDNLRENYKPHNSRKLTRETCLELLSVITQKTGYDKTMCAILGINSKLTCRLKNKEIYREYIKEYESLTQKEREQLLQRTMDKYSVEKVKNERLKTKQKDALTQEQVNYILDNKDLKTRVAISKELGISSDRVGNVILGKSYKDLVNNYYSSKPKLPC